LVTLLWSIVVIPRSERVYENTRLCDVHFAPKRPWRQIATRFKRVETAYQSVIQALNGGSNHALRVALVQTSAFRTRGKKDADF